MIGLELRERVATAVALREDGSLVARADADVTGDPVAAALTALDAVAGATAGPLTLGVAATLPEALATSDLLHAIARRYAGPFMEDGALPAGTAAAVAETWLGAGRGAQDVVVLRSG